MSKAIGLDLGSTLSEVCIIESGEPTVIVTEDGSRTLPSVVSISGDERKVGASAKRQQIVKSKETINLIKRFMGRTFDECGEAIKHVQYNVVNEGGYPRIEIEGKKYSPEEISSFILAKLKKMAEDYTGEEIKDAVITVPAFFSDAAKRATKTAGELAGLNVLRVIAEPTAAVLASKIDRSKGGKYLVVDFGGSTLDDSVADIDSDVVEILASNGDMWLGGADLDNAVAKYVIDEFQKENGIDLSKDPQAMTRIIEAVEKAKIELSGTANSEINLPYITANQNGPLHLVFNLTKAKFEQIIKPFIDRLISCAKKAVELAKIDKTDLNGIVLVGGSCRIPYVQKRLEEEFGCKLIKSADLDLAVAQGAAIQANILAGNTDGPGSDILLLDVTPLSIGIETMGGVMTKMVEANTTIPTHKEETFSTAENNQSMVMINVLQGERPMAADNKSLGQFMLDGIMPAPRGVPQIVVSFDVDANGILNVSAKDKATGKEQHITITGQSGLSKDEIERIKAEAEAHKSEDEKKQAEIQKLNQCESFAYGIENTLKEAGDKITEAEKNTVQPKLDALNEAIKTRNANEAEKLMKDVQDAFAPIATRLYQAGQQAQAQAEQPAQDTSSSTDQVQDADFEEVK